MRAQTIILHRKKYLKAVNDFSTRDKYFKYLDNFINNNIF